MSPELSKLDRILMTADTVGGVWTYALELAKGLQRHGVEVALATMGAPLNANQAREAAGVPNVTVYESAFKLEWMAQPWEDVAAAGEWLLGLEQRVRPDLIHLNGFAHGALPWRAPKVVVGHSCVLSWWRAVRGKSAPPEWDRYAVAVRAGLRAANLVVAPSRSMLGALEEHYGPLPAKVVIPNGRSRVSQNQHLPKQNFVFAAGRLWDAAKNITALASVADSLPWPVFVAGEAQSPDGESRQSAELKHLGHLPSNAVRTWLERASIYALPARYEPFGLSALEAGLARCALVLGDIPSLREIWGDSALFVPPDSPGLLRDVLLALMTRPNLRARYAAQAHRRAARFTTARMTAAYWRAYQWCLEESSAAEGRRGFVPALGSSATPVMSSRRGPEPEIGLEFSGACSGGGLA